MDDVLFEYDIRPNSEISRYDPVEWMGFGDKSRDVYNDIVFSECDEKTMGNLFEFLEKEKFVMVKKFKDQEQIVQKVMYCRATEEDLKRVEEGKLMLLGAAYDRFGVPEPNWKCKGCGFEWHYLYHLIF